MQFPADEVRRVCGEVHMLGERWNYLVDAHSKAQRDRNTIEANQLAASANVIMAQIIQHADALIELGNRLKQVR